MAVRLTPTQRHTARIFLRKGPSHLIDKALIEAGLVEANLTNPPGGDASSVGSLQEQSHYGSLRRRLNRRAAASRFVREAEGLLKKGFRGSAGELAQAVQRSAFPARYGQRSGQAEAIIRQLGGGRSADSGRSRGGGSRLRETVTTRKLELPGPQVTPPVRVQPIVSADIAGVKLGDPRPGAVRNLQIPQAEQPQPEPTTVTTQDVEQRRVKVRRQKSGRRRPSGGSISRAPSADRPGVSTKPAVKKFARKVSAVYGAPLTIGTGTRHSRLTVDGNVSDHWSGNAVDIPASGSKLTKLGQAALIAAGMNPRKARKIRGGLFNVGGHQVIFNTKEGGDHFTHLHISA
jgi:hypothetical protein